MTLRSVAQSSSMAVNFETVSQIAREYAMDMSQQLQIDKAIIFGSYAKGYTSKQSDNPFVREILATGINLFP